MKRILYGDLGSERMIFNETNLSEPVISALYRNVKTYSFGYKIFGNQGMWYYVNKYNQRGAGYISCVCDMLPDINDDDDAGIFSAPLGMFDIAFHNISEFEEEYRSGSYTLNEYPIFYPSSQHIALMYQKLLDVLPNGGKLVIYMPASQGKDVFISNAINFLARFIDILPAALNSIISFSIGEQNSTDYANISIVSSLNGVRLEDVVDITSEPENYIMPMTLAGYWTRCFDNENNFDYDLENLFYECVKNDRLNKGNTFYIPYEHLYNFYYNRNLENYNSLMLQYKNIIDTESLRNIIELDEFEAEVKKIKQEKQIKKQQEQIRKEQENIQKIENKIKKREDSLQGCLNYIDQYIQDMKEKYKQSFEYDLFEDDIQHKQEYSNYIGFFESMSKIAEYKSKQYSESVGKSSTGSWTNSNWQVNFDESVEKCRNISVEFELPYKDISEEKYLSNRYSGLLIYLRAIQNVNYINEAKKKKLREDLLNSDYSYNNCCYGRKVSEIVYYRREERKATLDYRTFLDITSLICLYVFVDDIMESSSQNLENLNKETIKNLMFRVFQKDGSLKNIALYHCAFLYSSVMDFFRNDKSSTKTDSISLELAKEFDVYNSISWLKNQLDKNACIAYYEHTFGSFSGFNILKKMNSLEKKFRAQKKR